MEYIVHVVAPIPKFTGYMIISCIRIVFEVMLFYISIHIQSGVATSDPLISSQGPALSSHTKSALHTAQKFTELKPK